MKFGTGVDVHEIVTWVKFDLQNLRGVIFTGGLKFGLLHWLCLCALTQCIALWRYLCYTHKVIRNIAYRKYELLMICSSEGLASVQIKWLGFASSRITEQILIRYCEKLQWKFIPIPRALFLFPYFYSHSHYHSRDSQWKSDGTHGISTVPITMHISNGHLKIWSHFQSVISQASVLLDDSKKGLIAPSNEACDWTDACVEWHVTQSTADDATQQPQSHVNRWETETSF